jgi:hypothetical protein
MLGWESINITLDPSLKKSLLRGDLHRFTCKTCGWSCPVVYPLLYHDMSKRLMIWLWPDASPPSTPALPFADDYKLRLVGSRNELIEKVRIFDHGLDDRVVEFSKYMVMLQLLQKGATALGTLFFAETRSTPEGGSSLVLEHVRDSGSESVAVDMDSYRQFSQTLAKVLPGTAAEGGKWLRTDSEYVTAMVARLT